MKYTIITILCLALAFASFTAKADEVTCFANDSVIYDGYGNDFSYEQSGAYLSFREAFSGQYVYVFGDCVIRVKKGHKKL